MANGRSAARRGRSEDEDVASVLQGRYLPRRNELSPWIDAIVNSYVLMQGSLNLFVEQAYKAQGGPSDLRDCTQSLDPCYDCPTNDAYFL